MPLKPGAAIELVQSGWEAYRRQRENAFRLDDWVKGKQAQIEERRTDDSMAEAGGIFMPDGQGTTREYADLISRSPENWAGLIVTNMAQSCFLDGVYRPGQTKDTMLRSWLNWQENGFDRVQNAIYRGAFGQGVSYVLALPARSALTGDPTSLWRGKSASRMAAFYEDEGNDEFPLFALEAVVQTVEGAREGETVDIWQVTLYDEEYAYYLEADNEGLDDKDWRYISREAHDSGVTPVVRYANQIDLDGVSTGEVEPIIPLLRRIDQDVFDRLVVQRFGAWKIRYATGLAKPQTTEERRAAEAILRMGELLVSSDPNSKFGTLDASSIKEFIEAHDVDLRTLAALTQMPPYHLLGLSSNLQSEALETAKDGLRRRSFERQVGFGESHETLFRLSAKQRGDLEEMRAFDMQSRWRDMETRTLSGAADALGKLATQVGVPQELLFEMIPGWTDIDVQRALTLVQSGAVESLFDAISRQQEAVVPPVPPTDDPDPGDPDA